ncbi:hypothetical protein J5Y03_06070 [Bacillus sp. RG28]|uniref:Uncharacterized protein n=1 Tax=Gottfriedia endophytica TaxID=2820819 RepID=A0A940NM86_9BACI|nr:hypothetical protein [Gottfriedia endophytica]MBP0724754.1 hypothetical protein [Gottfriedia endophytica]
MRKQLILLLIHQLFWLGFTIIMYLSQRDQLHSKIILFVVFFYQLYLIAKYIGNSKKVSIFITTGYAICFFTFRFLFDLF